MRNDSVHYFVTLMDTKYKENVNIGEGHEYKQ